jgi:hypothetical protein
MPATNHQPLTTVVVLPVAPPAAATTAGVSAATPAGTTTAAAPRTTIPTAASEVIARRTGFIYRQPPPLQGLAIQAGDGPLHVLAFSQFDESESPRLSGDFIANDYGRSCLKTRTTYKLTQFTVCHYMGKVPHE